MKRKTSFTLSDYSLRLLVSKTAKVSKKFGVKIGKTAVLQIMINSYKP